MESKLESFDEQLFSLKLQSMALQMHAESVAAGRLRGSATLIIDSQLEILTRYVEAVDQLYREVWETQGHHITSEFVTGIVRPRIIGTIEARTGSIKHGMELKALRTRQKIDHLALRYLIKASGQLKSQVNLRYDVEVRELQYRTKSRTESHRVRSVSKVPQPITLLAGMGGYIDHPKPSQVPIGLPAHFPSEIEVQSLEILAKAVKRFIGREQIFEMCKYIVAEMAPIFVAAVQRGVVRPNLATSESGMEGVLHVVLVSNCEFDRERFRLAQEVRRSEEWLSFVSEIANCERTLSQPKESVEKTRLTGTVTSTAAARRLEAYLEAKGIGQTEFANQAQTTDRTIRSFRSTGKVRRDILEGIARAMGTTKEELMKA